MRYESIDTISFTNHNNRIVAIKDKREYPAYEKLINIVTNADDKVDEIASRYEAYGDGGEDQSYKIVDYNIITIFETDFDMSKIKSLGVPV